MSASELQRGSPYQGLIPYEEADAPFFFGREKETRIISANLFASPLTLLYGASGVGKSSVLRAGVAHQLRAREELLVVVFNAWQSNPVIDLQSKIAEAAGRLNVVLDAPSQSTHLSDYLAGCANQLNRRLMIILDQFEEYFLYHPQDDEFAAEFSRAVTQSGAPVSFLISIREDFYAKLDRFEGRIPALYDNYLRIEHLDPDAARVAIEKPIAEYNRHYTSDGQFSIEPKLIDTVLRQVETGRVIIGEAGRGQYVDLKDYGSILLQTSKSGVVETAGTKEEGATRIETPFLQLVMTRLWEKESAEGSHKLRLQTLNDLGGAENIVRTHLDAVITKLSARDQEIAASIFHYLVTPSGTKIAYTASDLAGSAELKEEEVVRVLDSLAHGDVRILRTVEPSPDRPTAPRYEIFHDVLAPAILTWRTAYVQMQERADAERRAEEQKKRADEQARVAKRLRRLSVALAVVALLALASTVYAIQQRRQAQAFFIEAKTERERAQNQAELAKQRGIAADKAELAAREAQAASFTAEQKAETSRQETAEQIKVAEQRKAEAEKAQGVARLKSIAAAEANIAAGKATEAAEEQASASRVGYANLLAAQSRAAADEYPQRSLLLALEALNQPEPDDPPVPAAENALRQALLQTGGRVFRGHNAVVNLVAMSPNNRWMLSMDEEGVAYLWDLNATDANVAPHPLVGAHHPIAFTNDNRWLVTASGKSGEKENGTTALLWDLDNLSATPRNLSGHDEPVNSVIVSPNSRWLVTGSSSKPGAFVDTQKKRTARLWDLTVTDPAAKPITLPGDINFVVGISPNSHWLITDSRDENNKEGKTVSLWDLTAANPIAKSFVLTGHTGAITQAVTSPDGHWLATNSATCSFGTDTNVRLWDLSAPDPSSTPVILSAHKRPVGSVVFSPDSKQLITGGDGSGTTGCGSDLNSFLWNLAKPTAPPTNIGAIGMPIAFLPLKDKHFLLTQPSEYKTQLYGFDDKGGQLVLDLRGALVGSSVDRQLLITMDMDWLASAKQLAQLLSGATPHFKPPQLWNFTRLGDEIEPVILRGHESPITAADFSRDNHFLVTGGMDKMVRLWNLTNASINAAPLTLSESVSKYSIDPDSRWLAIRGPDNTVNVSDLSAIDPTANPIVLRGHEQEVYDVAGSPDNRWLATNSADGTVRLWDMSAANPSPKPKPLPVLASSMAFSRDNRWLATLGTVDRNATIQIWDVSASDPSANPKIWTTEVNSGATSYISPDNHWLIDFPHHRMWDISARALDFKSKGLQNFVSVTMSTDGNWLVYDNPQGYSQLWNLHDKNSSTATVHDLKDVGFPFVFSPDRRWLLASHGYKPGLLDLKAANPPAAEHILSTDVEASIIGGVFSPDGNWLAVAYHGGATLLWDLRDLNSKPFVLKGGNELNVSSLDISSDNRWLLTINGPSAKMWDLTARDPAAAAVDLAMSETFYDRAAFSRYDRNRYWLILKFSRNETEATALWTMQRKELVEQACRTAGRNLSETEWKEFFPDKPYHKTCPNFPVEQNLSPFAQ